MRDGLKTRGERRKEEGKRQKAKGKRQKARGKRQEAKGKRQKVLVTIIARIRHHYLVTLNRHLFPL